DMADIRPKNPHQSEDNSQKNVILERFSGSPQPPVSRSCLPCLQVCSPPLPLIRSHQRHRNTAMKLHLHCMHQCLQVSPLSRAAWRAFEMTEQQSQAGTKGQWIFHCGAKGLCPRCGQGAMFRKWLKLQDECPQCHLDYSFAAPDDGPAFFSLCIVA